MKKITSLISVLLIAPAFAGAVVNDNNLNNENKNHEKSFFSSFFLDKTPLTYNSSKALNADVLLKEAKLKEKSFAVAEPPLNIDELIKSIEDGDSQRIEPLINYKKMHSSYLSQMSFINAQIKVLTDRVSRIASGTFETKVREGSMMLGLVSEQIEAIVKDASKSEKSFKQFIKNKFNELAINHPLITHEQSGDVIIIEAKYDDDEENLSDVITVKKDKLGRYELISFIPKEIKEVNDIVNGLFGRAGAAERIKDNEPREITSVLDEAKNKNKNKNK